MGALLVVVVIPITLLCGADIAIPLLCGADIVIPLLCGADIGDSSFGALLFGDICGAGDSGSFLPGFDFGALDEIGDSSFGALPFGDICGTGDSGSFSLGFDLGALGDETGVPFIIPVSLLAGGADSNVSSSAGALVFEDVIVAPIPLL